MKPRHKPQLDETLTTPIPLPGGKRWVRLTVPRQMSDGEWTYLLNVLDVLKPGLVTPSEPLAEQSSFVDRHIDPDLMGPGEAP